MTEEDSGGEEDGRWRRKMVVKRTVVVRRN